MAKKYASYDQIELELQILKLEKEINYQKLVFSIQKTKESITPQNLLNGFLGSYKSSLSASYGSILNIAIPYIIKWYQNKKRGD
jgi:hypothetical protein